MADQKERSKSRRTAIQRAQDDAKAARQKRAAAAKKEQPAADAQKSAPQATSGIPWKDPRDAEFEQQARDEGWDTPDAIAFHAAKYRKEAEKQDAKNAAPGNQIVDTANRVTENAKRLAEQQAAATPSRPMADPKNYGQSDFMARLRASRSASEARRLNILRKQGKALIYLGPARAPQSKQRYGQPGDFAQTKSEYNEVGAAGQVVGDSIADDTTLLGWIYDPAHRKMILDQAKKAGLQVDGTNFDELEKVWQTVLKRAAVAYNGGQKITPWAVMGLMAKAGEGRPSSRTTTQTSIEEMDPAHARRVIAQAAKEMLGREPTKDQIDDFISRAQLAAEHNPRVTNTTTQYDAAGEAVSSTSRTHGGVTDDQLAQEAEDMAQSDPTYAEYQAVGTYMPALFDLVNSTVG